VSDERPLAAASRRRRGIPGFPRAAGRPRKRAPDGHVSGHDDNAVSQPRTVTSENGDALSAGVRSAPAPVPTASLEQSAGVLVKVPPALLSVADAGVYLGGLSVRTIEGLIAAGLLVPVRLPSPRGGRHLGRCLLERAALDRLVEQARGRS